MKLTTIFLQQGQKYKKIALSIDFSQMMAKLKLV